MIVVMSSQAAHRFLITEQQSKLSFRDYGTSWGAAASPNGRWLRLKPADPRPETLAASRSEAGGVSRENAQLKEVLQMDSVEDLADDERFMMAAMEEARKAFQAGEVPVGAVLVHRGAIVARAHNRVECDGDPTAHAEMLCIRQAAKILGGWRLIDSALYITLEPCPMCAGAILQARVGEIVWGAKNRLLGADGSWISLFPRDSVSTDSEVRCSCKDEKSPRHPFHPDLVVRRGVLAAASSELMKNFFKMRRTSQQKHRPILTGSCTSFWLQVQPSLIILRLSVSRMAKTLAQAFNRGTSW